jgi:HlyD family secretion protein
VVGCCLLCLTVALCGCRGAAEEEHESPPVEVRTELVQKRTLRPSFIVIGTVMADPQRQATLSAATPGLVDKLIVREGAKVKQGDPIVQLDQRKAASDLEKAEAALARLIAKPRPEELAQARALVEKTQAAHLLAETRLRKSRDLRKQNPELVPDVQLLDDEHAKQAAKAELDVAQLQLQLLEKGPREEQRREARAEVQAAKLQWELCQVTAKFDGQVVELKARAGQQTEVGTPLAVLLDTREVIIQARVPSNRLSLVAERMAQTTASTSEPLAQVWCSSSREAVLPAVSGWLSQQTEAATPDVLTKLRVANPLGLLRVGMSVQVELFGPAVECLAIPEVAVTLNEEGEHVVTIVHELKDKEGNAKKDEEGHVLYDAGPREIELAAPGEPEVRAGGWVRVVKGLQEGDLVAVENGYALPEGTHVELMPKEEPKAASAEKP